MPRTKTSKNKKRRVQNLPLAKVSGVSHHSIAEDSNNKTTTSILAAHALGAQNTTAASGQSKVKISKKGRLKRIFLSYLAMTFVFAGIYQWIYIINPKSFSFNEDIQKSQRQSYVGWREAESKRLLAERSSAEVLLAEFSRGRLPVFDSQTADAYTLVDHASLDTESFSFSFKQNYKTKGDQEAPTSVEIHVKSRSGEDIGTTKLLQTIMTGNSKIWPVLAKEFYDAVYDTNSALIKKYQSELAEADGVSAPRGLWGFIDFLYFSTITIATVGYGDILPNASSTRIFVMLEILIGSLLLIYALNSVAFDD